MFDLISWGLSVSPNFQYSTDDAFSPVPETATSTSVLYRAGGIQAVQYEISMPNERIEKNDATFSLHIIKQWAFILKEALDKSFLVAKFFCAIHVTNAYLCSTALISTRHGKAGPADVVVLQSPENPKKFVPYGLLQGKFFWRIWPAGAFGSIGRRPESVDLPLKVVEPTNVHAIHQWPISDNLFLLSIFF
ncbi:hypothetical protein L1987_59162 [Smallanthus sonchifolius]|uniref:Uncharacterized protein n=1 Tax=Smallanthus sonchifolius TaxID=185202 RepID=A0ACB9D4G1_9ASTR|nr:hypothetical protein L1987_59162 [Smallanthus sonchifolius]